MKLIKNLKVLLDCNMFDKPSYPQVGKLDKYPKTWVDDYKNDSERRKNNGKH